MVTVIATILIVKKTFENKIAEEYDRLVNQAVMGIEDAKKYYGDRLFKSAFLQAYTVIELYIRKELLKTGHMIKYSRDNNLYVLAKNSKILSNDVMNKIHEFISIRNIIIHTEQSGDQSYANSIIQFVEELF